MKCLSPRGIIRHYSNVPFFCPLSVGLDRHELLQRLCSLEIQLPRLQQEKVYAKKAFRESGQVVGSRARNLAGGPRYYVGAR